MIGTLRESINKLIINVKTNIINTGEIDIGEFVGLMFPRAAELISNLKQNFRLVLFCFVAYHNSLMSLCIQKQNSNL